MRKAGAKNYLNYSQKILAITKKPVSCEVFSDDEKNMILQGLNISKWGSNVYVKVPVTNSKGKFMGNVIKKLNKSTWVEVQIYTGRSHQIRIHAASINHPIIFDDRYGDKAFNKRFDKSIRKKIALHSKSIHFMNLDSKIINIKCNPPNEFNSLVKMLK